MEVAIEKTLHLLLGEVVGKHAEVCLQLKLVEIDVGGLEETILEIVEVEEHTVGIKLRLGIALCEIQSTSTANLHIGQLAYGADEQFFLLHIISPSCLATALERIEERHTAEVLLKIA